MQATNRAYMLGLEEGEAVWFAGARLLTLSAPARFADFVRAAGESAPAPTVPPAAPVNVEGLAALAAQHGIEILGPPV